MNIDEKRNEGLQRMLMPYRNTHKRVAHLKWRIRDTHAYLAFINWRRTALSYGLPWLCLAAASICATTQQAAPPPAQQIQQQKGARDKGEILEKLSKHNCKALGITDGKCAIRIKPKKAADTAPVYVEPKQCYMDGTCDLPDGSALNTNASQ